MLSLKKLQLLFFSLTILFTACEPKDKDKDPAPASTLTANAGVDQNVQTGQKVILDGHASKDNENKPFTFAWSFTKKPTNSQATLAGANTAKPTFVPDLAGEYELELTISNAASSQKDKVSITASFTALVLADIAVKTVLEDRIADFNLPDYLVNEDIAISAELTVKPGVVIAFAEDKRMEIKENGGVIIAKGEADKKIKFTGQKAEKGFWGGILVWSNSSANEFSHAEILYAGSGIPGEVNKTSIMVYDQARLTLKNTTIAQSGGFGLYLSEGAKLVAFAANNFNNNTDAPLLLTANHVPKLDAATVFTSNNGRNVIEVMRSSITGTSEVVWPAFNDNTPYRFIGLVDAQTGWKLSPGITIEVVEDNYIEVADGYLNAVGTPEKKITITGVVKTVGSWNGIIVYTRSAHNVMENVQINYAGGAEILSGVKASLNLTHGGSLAIKKSSINYSGGYGIYVYGDDSTLNADATTTNNFTSNALSAVYYRN